MQQDIERNYLKNQAIVFELKHKIQEIADRSNFNVEIMEVNKDHIHILINYDQNISIVQIVRRLKQETQHQMWIIFEKELRKVYWKDLNIFWYKGYFVCSIGEGASYKTIQDYIKNQG